LRRAAERHGGAPLLFPGMGHDLPLDARWREPIDAILDWLDKNAAGADRGPLIGYERLGDGVPQTRPTWAA
jgi:hypothetical protein